MPYIPSSGEIKLFGQTLAPGQNVGGRVSYLPQGSTSLGELRVHEAISSTAIATLEEVVEFVPNIAGELGGYQEQAGLHREAAASYTALESGNVVFLIPDDGWKYLSSGVYTKPVDELEGLDSTVWW
mgnify:CR=1 FL=1